MDDEKADECRGPCCAEETRSARERKREEVRAGELGSEVLDELCAPDAKDRVGVLTRDFVAINEVVSIALIEGREVGLYAGDFARVLRLGAKLGRIIEVLDRDAHARLSEERMRRPRA